MSNRRRDERGQVIVIVALAMVVMLIGTAFVVDADLPGPRRGTRRTRRTQQPAPGP